ncbi:MAG: hypothetical protein OEY62_06135, partial [Acidimicrobiia bacterium]|nr:hypothetical protein [Acidimicrobiia bacterium]
MTIDRAKGERIMDTLETHSDALEEREGLPRTDQEPESPPTGPTAPSVHRISETRRIIASVLAGLL